MTCAAQPTFPNVRFFAKSSSGNAENGCARWGDLGATKKAQLSIGPSSQISLGIKLVHWKLPWWIRFVLGHGTHYAFFSPTQLFGIASQ